MAGRRLRLGSVLPSGSTRVTNGKLLHSLLNISGLFFVCLHLPACRLEVSRLFRETRTVDVQIPHGIAELGSHVVSQNHADCSSRRRVVGSTYLGTSWYCRVQVQQQMELAQEELRAVFAATTPQQRQAHARSCFAISEPLVGEEEPIAATAALFVIGVAPIANLTHGRGRA